MKIPLKLNSKVTLDATVTFDGSFKATYNEKEYSSTSLAALKRKILQDQPNGKFIGFNLKDFEIVNIVQVVQRQRYSSRYYLEDDLKKQLAIPISATGSVTGTFSKLFTIMPYWREYQLKTNYYLIFPPEQRDEVKKLLPKFKKDYQKAITSIKNNTELINQLSKKYE